MHKQAIFLNKEYPYTNGYIKRTTIAVAGNTIKTGVTTTMAVVVN